MPEVILASSSRARREMLERAGVVFRIVPAAVDEEAVRRDLLAAEPDTTPEAVAVALAKAKAADVSRAHPGTLVIGADQTLQLGDRLVSKSPDMAAARRLLLEMRGARHCLHSAVALASDGQIEWSHCDTATLAVRPFTDAFLDEYLATSGDRILSSVGCYELEGRGAQLFDRVDGDFFTVLGLPLLALLQELRSRGVLPE